MLLAAIPPMVFVIGGIAIVAVTAIVCFRSFLKPAGTANDQPSKRTVTPDRRTGGLLDVDELAQRLEVPVETLLSIQPSYREARIPKPKGGERYLQIPDDATKELQKKINQRLLKTLKSHPFCYGFEPYTSIVDAAAPHVNQTVVVKMDIRRFFDSTTEDRIQDYFAFIGWNQQAAKRLTELTTYRGTLPQGAPTSPRLSNLVNTGMDELLASIAAAHHGNFSRYADDITMSFTGMNGRRVRGVIQEVRRVLDKFGYTMHGKGKLKIYRRHQRQQVLGLVVNEGVRLPRTKRRWLRAVRHRLETTGSATLTAEQLDGWLAFQSMVEKHGRSAG